MSIASQLSFSTATSLLAGAAGSIPYQSATSSTTFLAIGTNGYVLTSNGSAPYWAVASGGGTTTAALTMNNGGSGDASGTTFNGSTARTISYNTVGASKAPASAYNGVYSLDSRAVVDTPTSRDAGLYVDFKANTTDSLADGGTYHGVLTFRSYGASTDISGGQTAQLGYTDNGNLWHRLGSSTTAWGTWYKLINTNNATTTNIQFQSLGVGTAASGTTGEIRATNEITAYYSSDINLKENIRLIADPLGKLAQIRGVHYDWTDEHIQKRGGEDGYFVRKHDIGVIAQEVEAVLPEIVATRDDGTKVVKYEKLVALLIEAVKDQQRQINQISQAVQNMAVK
jgi:hypothetical protein